MQKKYFLLCLIFVICILFLNSQNIYSYLWYEDLSYLPVSANISAASENPLGLTCGSAILIEQNSGQILYSHNIHEKLRPASVTKIMTILLIMEEIDSGKLDYTDPISCSENAASMGGSQIWLDSSEVLTVDEMLKAICVVSANDASVAMAEHIAGSEENFVLKMNEKAKQLGMNDTCFKNCHGLDEEGHLTSAYDIALMSRELLKNHPNITKYTTIWMDSLRDGKSELVNTNKLLRNYSGCTGLKTGSTSTALFNLSASATRDNLSLIAVIMRGETSKIRFDEAQKILNYGFSNFEYFSYCKSNEIIKQIPVNKGTLNFADIITETSTGSLIPKGQSSNIVTNINLPEKLEAPIKKGNKVGEINFYLADTHLGTVNLISNQTVAKLNFGNMLAHITEKWFNLLR